MIRTATWGLALLALVAGGLATAGEKETSWTLKSSLKQIDKATKGLYGVTSRIDYAEHTGPRPIEGTGTFSIRLDGKARAEVEGTDPRTLLLSRPYLYLYDANTNTVRTYHLPSNRGRLAQYVPVGFFPSGSGLKKRFTIEAFKEEMLGGRPTVFFRLKPKPKDVLLGSVSAIRLWIDTQSWLPVQQEIVHRQGGTRIAIRYLDPTPVDQLDDALFRPVWPEGAQPAE